MSGPYRFELDRDSGTWTAYNAKDAEIAAGDLPLRTQDRRLAIFNDQGISGPTAQALIDIWEGNWTDENL